jgi:DNA repair protein RecO (recombination protein O)
MRVEQQPGFVLHARPWRETSLLLDVLTRDFGRIGLIARGVRGAKTRLPRSQLQPLLPLVMSYGGAGELATLTAAEARRQGGELAGEALLCALYVNELVARLLPRNDAHDDVFDAYRVTLARLAGTESTAWTLRRFERDLLASLGYGAVLDCDESGAPLQAERDYAYRFDAGPVPWRAANDGLRLRGSALLALGLDRQPDVQDLAALRRLMRGLIAHHLGGASLRAWSLFQVPPAGGSGRSER